MNAKQPQWEKLCRSERDCVYDGSSYVEGFSGHRSDSDIYLAFDENHPANRSFPSKPIEFHASLAVTANGMLIDIEPMSLRWLSLVGQQVNETSLADKDAIANIQLERLNTYYRTAIGIPLHNEEAFASLRNTFSKARINLVFHTWCGTHAARKIAEAKRNLRADADSAFVAARDAVMFATDSLLAEHGEGFTGRKFRFSKLRRAFGRDSEQYEKAWRMKSLGDRSIQSYFELAEEYCHRIGIQPVDSARQKDIPTRARDVEMFSLHNEIVLVRNRSSIYRLDEFTGNVWSLVNNARSIDQIAEFLAAKTTEASDRPKVAATIARLAEVGLCGKTYAPKH